MFNISEHLQELRSSIIAISLLLATTILGLVWISIGVSSLLINWVGPLWGPVLLGGIFLLPILCYALAKIFVREPQKIQSLFSHHNTVEDSMVNMGKIIGSLSGQSPLLVTLVAVVAGFLATRFPAVLSVFTQLVAAYAEDVKVREREAAKHQQSAAEQSPPKTATSD